MGVRARDSISLFSAKTVYDEILAHSARIGIIEANYVTTDTLAANYVTTDTLEANYITASSIAATYATLSELHSDYITAGTIAATYASIATLESDYVSTNTLEANYITSDAIASTYATLDTITAINTTIAGKADINLLNTTLINGQAIVTQSGYINNATITDLTTDKLRVLGEDGLYYAINVTGGAVSADVADADLETYGTQLTGQTIINNTITADKLFVNDLSAIHGTIGTAMIGGLTLENSSIHSASKTAIKDNNTGLLFNAAGEMELAGVNSYLRFYNDSTDNNKRKLEIKADSLVLASGNSDINMSTIAGYASKSVKSTTQLWFTKANTTPPTKPNSVISSTSTAGNAWRVVVPVYNATYPYYYYCFQYLYNDGTYGWGDVVLDRATSETQATANSTSGALTSYITSNNSAMENLQSQIDGQIEAWYFQGEPQVDGNINPNDPALSWTTLDEKKRHLGDLYFDVVTGHSWRYLTTDDTDINAFSWSAIPDSDAAAALAVAQNAQSSANSKNRIFTVTPTVPYDVGDIWVYTDPVTSAKTIRYSTVSRSTGSYTASDWVLAATDDTAANAAQATANSAIKSTEQLWFAGASTTKPNKPTGKITSDSTAGNAWRIVVPVYDETYPYYFYCYQYEFADGTYGWSAVVYDSATSDAQRLGYDISETAVTNLVTEYAINNSSTTAPTTGWNTTIPSWQSGQYIWRRTSQTVDGVTTSTEPECITTVLSVEKEYYRSTSNAELIGGTWSTTVPDIETDTYLWTRDKLNYSYGNYVYTDPVCVSKYTNEIMLQPIEDAKTSVRTYAAGLVQDEATVRLEATSKLVQKSDYEQFVTQTNTALQVNADGIAAAATKTQVNSIIDDLGNVTEYTQTIGKYLTFDADNGLTLSALNSAVKTVLDNTSWKLMIGDTVVQKVDATDGAQFTAIKIAALASGDTPSLTLGDLMIVVESDGSLTGRKAG